MDVVKRLCELNVVGLWDAVGIIELAEKFAWRLGGVRRRLDGQEGEARS